MKKIGIALIAFMIIISGCTNQGNSSNPTPTPVQQTQKPTPTPVITPAITATSQAQADCGTDLNCFINAVKAGKSAKTLYTSTVNLSGIIQTTEIQMENKKQETSGYEYQQKIKNISVKFSKEIEEKMLKNGLSQEEIDQQKKQVNEQLKLAVGTGAICQYSSPGSLTEVLEKWGQGNYSTKDLDFCTKFTPIKATPAPKPTQTATPKTTPPAP